MSNTKAVYVPYTGGTGPTEEQVSQNNNTLHESLQSLGVKVVEDGQYMQQLCGIDQKVLKITHPKTNCNIYVSYDRWGFVIDEYPDEDAEVDQISLDDAINLICTWYSE